MLRLKKTFVEFGGKKIKCPPRKKGYNHSPFSEGVGMRAVMSCMTFSEDRRCCLCSLWSSYLTLVLASINFTHFYQTSVFKFKPTFVHTSRKLKAFCGLCSL